ncbi:MAG: PAS domain S-box protein [Bacteroidetes bacterium]|nr:PAS domain S-box protein [Bacteroidota bacterium]
MDAKKTLKILILEENQSEIKLIESILMDSEIQFESKNAKTENDFFKYVNRFRPDIILAGTNLTKYSVHEALSFLKEQSLLIPFILITGAIPEELAKDYLKNGVDEYLTKFNLLTLPSVITKAIGIKATIKQKIVTDELNKENEAKLQTFFDNNPESIFELSFNCEIINLNKSAKDLLGISETKLAGKKIKLSDYLESSNLKDFKEIFANSCRGFKRSILAQFQLPKKEIVWLDCKFLPLFNHEQNVSSVLLIAINATEKEKAKSELSYTKTNYEKLASSIDEALLSVDKNFNVVQFNDVASKMIHRVRGINVKSGTTLKEFARSSERVIIWSDRFNRALSGEKFHVEDIFELSGEKLYAQITLYPIYDNNEIVGVTILGRDISDYKKAEIELKKSEQIFRTLSENAPVGIIKLDDNGNCIYANEYMTNLLGTTFEKVSALGWLDFIHKDDKIEFYNKLNKFLGSKRNLVTKIRFSGKDQETIWTKVGIAIIESEEGTSSIGTVTNITDLKKAYDNLNEKQVIIDSVEQNPRIGFWVRDFQNEEKALWSESVYKIFEQDKANGPIPITNLVSLIHPDDRETFIQNMNSVRNGLFINQEYRILPKSGILKYIFYSAYPILDKNNHIVKISGTILDLTDNYTKDKELNNQKILMTSAFEIASIGLWEHNVAERTTIWSKETKRIFGLKDNEAPLSLEVYSAIIHPDDRKGFLDFFNQQVITGKPGSFEYRIFIHGEIRTHLTFSHPFLNKLNKAERLTGIIIDKTSNRKTENSLKATEKLFNSFFENIPNAIFIEDRDGNILNVNKKGCELQGMEKAALIGKNISDLIPINDKVKILSDFRKMFDGEISEISSKSYKLSGESSTVEINAMKITYKDIPAVLLNVREV